MEALEEHEGSVQHPVPNREVVAERGQSEQRLCKEYPQTLKDMLGLEYLTAQRTSDSTWRSWPKNTRLKSRLAQTPMKQA